MALKTPNLVRLLFRSFNDDWPKFLANIQQNLAKNRKKIFLNINKKYLTVFGHNDKNNWKGSSYF